ncbi:MAG TPA: glycine oxidase ThiO [Parasulfuritortus sp.]
MNRHIIVIGAGVSGLAAAWALSGRGHRVEVLERGHPGQESSWAGAGILSMLLPWSYHSAAVDLTELSLARYPDWIDDIRRTSPIDPEYRRCGMLVRPPYDRTAAATWAARHRAIEPPAALAGYGPGLWLPDTAQVRNPRLIQALADGLARRGVPIHHQIGPVHLQTQAGQVVAVVSSDQRWQADLYVAAAGAWSAELLGQEAAGLPIRPIRGQMLLYKSEPGRLPCVLYEDGKYLVPRADGHILAGSTLEDVGFDKCTTDEARATLHDFTRRMLPDVAAGGSIRHWAGLRPGSPDNIPIIARHPTLANLFANCGHFRYGVTMAPASADLLADLIEDKPTELAPRLFAWPDIIRAAPV